MPTNRVSKRTEQIPQTSCTLNIPQTIDTVQRNIFFQLSPQARSTVLSMSGRWILNQHIVIY
jgi:hypothetical protein